MTDGGRTDGGKWKIVQCSVGPETAKAERQMEVSNIIVPNRASLEDVSIRSFRDPSPFSASIGGVPHIREDAPMLFPSFCRDREARRPKLGGGID